eukprot:2434212-Prymnesium_polylepis.1
MECFSAAHPPLSANALAPSPQLHTPPHTRARASWCVRAAGAEDGEVLVQLLPHEERLGPTPGTEVPSRRDSNRLPGALPPRLEPPSGRPPAATRTAPLLHSPPPSSPCVPSPRDANRRPFRTRSRFTARGCRVPFCPCPCGRARQGGEGALLIGYVLLNAVGAADSSGALH